MSNSSKRADTFPATKRFTRHGQPPCVQLAASFLDALVLCCLGPPDYPSIEDPIQYVRPAMPNHFRILNKDARRRIKPGCSTGPVIVISDSESESNGTPPPSVDNDNIGAADNVAVEGMEGIIATPGAKTQYQVTGSTIPRSVLEIIKDPKYDERMFSTCHSSANVLTFIAYF